VYKRQIEEHIFTDEIRIWSSTPAVPVLPGDTIMGRLAAMENATGAVAQANSDAVWDEALSGHTTPGTAGQILQSCCQGQTGANQLDITIQDTGATPIQGAQVDVYDGGNTTFLSRSHTDINGETAFALDDGTYNLRLWATGYSFTTPVFITITTDMSVTYNGISGIVINPPSTPDLCVIYGYINDAAGQPIGGACVTATPTTPQSVDGAQTADNVIHILTREDGYFEMELVRGAEVRFEVEHTGYSEIKVVPDSPSQDLTTWV